mgnify:CR=1 FL=1
MSQEKAAEKERLSKEKAEARAREKAEKEELQGQHRSAKDYEGLLKRRADLEVKIYSNKRNMQLSSNEREKESLQFAIDAEQETINLIDEKIALLEKEGKLTEEDRENIEKEL